MELQVGVKVLLKNSEGKYLLLMRSDKKYPEAPPKWDIAGGRINPGTPLLENLKREVKEETNLDLKKDVQLVAAQDILRIPGRHVVRLTYLGEADGNPRIDEEHTDFRWFGMAEMKNLRDDELDKYFKDLLDRGIIK